MTNQLTKWGGLLLLLFLVGCGANDSQTDEEQRNPNGEKMADIAFEHVELEEAPSSIQSAVEFKSHKEATFVLPGEEKQTYLVVTRGEKPTSGYTVDIANVEDHGDAIVVRYKYKDPGDDELVNETLTYPVDIVKIAETDKQVKFEKIEHINEKNEGFNIQL